MIAQRSDKGWLNALHRGGQVPAAELNDVQVAEIAITISEELDGLPVSEAMRVLDTARCYILAGTTFREADLKAALEVSVRARSNDQEL